MEAMGVDPDLEVDMEKLELDVRQMAQKISEYRQTLNPHYLLDSVLFPNIDSRLTIPETELVPVVLGTEEQDSREKMIQIKERISRNAANVPKVVKRMRECISSIEKLDSLELKIHPVFRKPRIN